MQVWTDFGRCLFTNFFVRPGKVFKNPLSIAWTSVDLMGDPSDARYNLARSVLVVLARMMALIEWRTDDGGVFWGRFTIYIPLV